MRIQKYSVGGINYIPVSGRAAGQTPAASTTSSNDSKVPGFTKEIIDLVKENGLENDVNLFLNKAQSVLALAADPTGEHLSMTEILKLAKDANKVRQNAESAKKAESAMDQQESWGTFATDSRGNLWTQNRETGKIGVVSLATYKENKDEYIPLTNAELLDSRKSEKHPELGYNTTMLDNIAASVGMKAITAQVKTLIDAIGTSTITGYTNKQQQELEKGLQTLMAGGPDGTYKFTKEEQLQDSNLDGVLNYIYNNLPSTYQNTLKAKAVIDGYDEEKYGVKTLIAQMAWASTDRKLAVDFDKTATEGSHGGSGGSGSTATKEYTLAETYATGEGAPVGQYYDITPSGSNARLFVYGQNMGPVMEKDGKDPMNMCTLDKVMNDAYAVRGVTDGTASFGDQVLNRTDMGSVLYDQSEMRRVVMPSKVVNGEIVPDLELAEKIEQIQNSLQGEDEITAQQYLNKILPGAHWNSATNTIVLPNNMTHAFLTFGAIASSAYFKDLNVNSKYIERMSEDEERKWKERYDVGIKYGYVDPSSTKQITGHDTKGFLRRNKLYRANVFIPITGRLMGSAIYNPQELSKALYMNTTERDAAWERSLQLKDQQRQTNFTE